MRLEQVWRGQVPLPQKRKHVERLDHHFQKSYNDRHSIHHFHCDLGIEECDDCWGQLEIYKRLKLSERIKTYPEPEKRPAAQRKPSKRQKLERDYVPGLTLSDILDVRSSPSDGQIREFLVMQRSDERGVWLPKTALSRELEKEWIAKRDRRDKFLAFTVGDKQAAKRKQAKDVCNAAHCAHVQVVLDLTLVEDGRHGTLAHYRDWSTVRALLALGIDPRDLDIPQPFAFAKSCGRGIPHVYDCLLSDLAQYVDGKLLSMFADFTSTWSEETREEIRRFLVAALRADYFAFSLTLCRSRQEPNVIDLEHEVVVFIRRLIRACGFDFYNFLDYHRFIPYRVEKGMQMYFFSWIFERVDGPPPAVIDLGGSSDNEESTTAPAETSSAGNDTECNCGGTQVKHFTDTNSTNALPYVPLVQALRCFFQCPTSQVQPLVQSIVKTFPNDCLTTEKPCWLGKWDWGTKDHPAHWRKPTSVLVHNEALVKVLTWAAGQRGFDGDAQAWHDDHEVY